MPQIEVTFDIDANGIVNVSAKDLGTGKEQHITITSSTNMSKEDVEKAVKEAERYAAEDKQKREEVDTRNAADQMVFTTEKALNELGDKVTAEEKDVYKRQPGCRGAGAPAPGGGSGCFPIAWGHLLVQKLFQNVRGAAGQLRTGTLAVILRGARLGPGRSLGPVQAQQLLADNASVALPEPVCQRLHIGVHLSLIHI